MYAGGQVVAGSASPKESDSRDSEIIEQLMMQEGSISYLTGMLERLRSKLYPVLQQEQLNKDNGNAATVMPSLSPFGETLRSHTHRIQACTAEVEKLIYQLAV